MPLTDALIVAGTFLTIPALCALVEHIATHWDKITGR